MSPAKPQFKEIVSKKTELRDTWGPLDGLEAAHPPLQVPQLSGTWNALGVWSLSRDWVCSLMGLLYPCRLGHQILFTMKKVPGIPWLLLWFSPETWFLDAGSLAFSIYLMFWIETNKQHSSKSCFPSVLMVDFTRKPHVDKAWCTLGTSARSVSSVMSPSAVALKELLSQTPL